MKLKFKLIFFFLFAFLVTRTVWAQDSDATDSASQIREAVKEAVKDKIENVTTKKIGLVGKLSLITESSLELSTDQDKYAVITNEDTTYQKIPGSNKIKREDLELNSDAIILGTESLDEKNSIDAKIIQLIKKPEVPVRNLVSGTVVAVTSSNLLMKVDGKNTTVQFSRSTDIYDKLTNGELSDISYKNLEEGDTLIVGGSVDEEESSFTGLIVLRVNKK